MKISTVFVTFFSLAVVLGHSQNLPQICFEPYSNPPSGNTPRGVTAADFNGDGIVDLATANQLGNNVSILMGLGTGSFAPPVVYQAGTAPWGIITDDFNADGKPDLAVGHWDFTNYISILLGTATGSFSAPYNLYVGADPREIVAADFNGDGKVDLASANFSGGNVSVLLATGNGYFASAVNYSTGINGPWGITADDFNGDGLQDIAVANMGGNDVSVLLGTGGGNFNSITNFPVGNYPQGIVSADFNLDSKPDLAITDSGPFGGANVAILLGTGNGAFGGANYFVGGTSPGAITTSDYNADGKPDLAVSDFGGGSLFILRGTGTGSFGIAGVYVAGSGSGILSADLNGDAAPDLAKTVYSGYATKIFLNIPPPTVTVVSNRDTVCLGEAVTFTAAGATHYAWLTNGSPAPTVYAVKDNTVFVTSSTSTFALIGLNSVSGCTASVKCEVELLPCTGITNYSVPVKPALFPNPAGTEIKIDVPSEKNVTVEIFNHSGQLVLRLGDYKPRSELKISELEEGIYFYRVTGEIGSYPGRFIKLGN